MFLIFRIFFHIPPDSMCFHEKGFADHLGLRPLEVLRPASFCEPAIDKNDKSMCSKKKTNVLEPGCSNKLSIVFQLSITCSNNFGHCVEEMRCDFSNPILLG